MSTPFKYSNYNWNVINEYFSSINNILITHQLDGYDDFINIYINTIIRDYNPIIINNNNVHIEIIFGKFYLLKPRIYENNGVTRDMMPHDARLRSFTYNSEMLIDLVVNITQGEEKYSNNFHKVSLCHIPVMVGSSICNLNLNTHVMQGILKRNVIKQN